MSGALFHIVDRAVWAGAVEHGYYAPDSLRTEGFVHLSFADQVAGVANARYRDVPDLAVVELDPARLGVEVRVEDSYGEGREFPHAYGPLPTDAAVALHDLGTAADGTRTFLA